MTSLVVRGRCQQRAVAWLSLAAIVLLLSPVAMCSAARAAETPRGKVRFNRDIRPILSENCFRCHGPDPGSREAGLRFDREEGLFEDQGSGAPVVRGKPEESLLFQRITADDEYTVMPPPETHKKLTAEQKDLVARWIAEGAAWEPHWSLVKPARPALPTVSDPSWVRNSIDRFILEALDDQGLRPAAEADRRTIIRRVSFDLTGLPPTPAEVEAFVADTADDAYERLVDRLLSSEHYGEHRARYWLDAARYADTHGLHIDNYREIWPYREWVISAFNRNLSFERFTIEQLAGDLLPDATLDQQIASGFHRCNITTNEGGSIAEEVAAIYAKDRVETTATVWLGLTAGCAACHDHKFDPFTQREFYQLAAYFRNTTQNPLDGNISDTPPVIVVPHEDDRERWLAIDSKIKQLESEKQARRNEAASAFEAWLRDGGHRELAQPIDAADQELALALQESAGSTQATAIVAGAEQSIALAGGVSLGDGSLKSSRAARFEKRAALDLGNVADFEADQPFSVSAWVFTPLEDGAHAIISKLGRNADGRGAGWSITITSRLLLASLSSGKKGDTAARRANGAARLTPGKWSHVCMTYDGSRRATGISLFVNGKPLSLNQVRPGENEIKGSLRNDGPLMIGADGTRSFDGGAIHDLRIDRRPIRDDEIQLAMRWRNIRTTLSRSADQLNQKARDDLLLAYLNLHDETYRAASQALADARLQIDQIRARGSITHVMHEIVDSMPMANVLVRGQYDQLGDRVEPAAPAMLHPLPSGAPRSRLGLAHWLVDAENPLTARVTVNRFWQEIFGTGLVRSSEDFGIMGESASHPELLDWLAVEFRESGWNVKELFRLMVTSAAYRQAAAATDDKLKLDPNNRLLSRGPRFRLDAEMLRDYALAASGLLVREIGGPSVKPYQPEGVWEAVAMNSSNTREYVQDHGDNLYRRSMYTFWKRSAPPASMDIFNAPSRENCTVRRERTNTPLQALVTMNDPQFVEAARHLAERALSETTTTFGQRLDFMTLHLVSRPFETHERDVCRSALDAYRAYFAERRDAAEQLIATGESKPCGSVDAAELAAWTMLANQLMNLDEALNK